MLCSAFLFSGSFHELKRASFLPISSDTRKQTASLFLFEDMYLLGCINISILPLSSLHFLKLTSKRTSVSGMSVWLSKTHAPCRRLAFSFCPAQNLLSLFIRISPRTDEMLAMLGEQHLLLLSVKSPEIKRPCPSSSIFCLHSLEKCYWYDMSFTCLCLTTSRLSLHRRMFHIVRTKRHH